MVAGKDPAKVFAQTAKFDMELFQDILKDLMSGQYGSLKRICERKDIHVTTFYNWIHVDPDLMEAYKVARKFQAHILVDDAMEDANEEIDGRSTAHAMMAKLKVDTKMKVAGMFNREWYGNKTEEISTVAVKHEMTEDQFLKIRQAMLDKKKSDNASIEDAKIVE